jgi:hypothetical protein
MNIPPEETLRELKHVDPWGRLNLGRRYAFRTYTAIEHMDGRILLSPVEIVEKNKMDDWRRAIRLGKTPPPPPDPIHRIPPERR